MKRTPCLLLLIWLCLFGVVQAQEIPVFDLDEIDIPYQKFVLDNGLRLIVHEDHKAPIVAVNVWYHVGSKNEKPGKTGFAHLFEHLMFNGSENFNKDYFLEMESIGGTDLNGTTNYDRTNYFQNVPVGALDRLLWLESDRMGHLLGAIDQAKLDEQRGVVQNEKRQGENQPYGRSRELITKATYPNGHPYSWTVIGEMEDLDAANLEDVKEWFTTYYGAANAVLVIAGDVDPDEVHEKVKKYFGGIAPGPTLQRQQVNIAPRMENTRQSYQDRVPEARIHMVWNVPQWGTQEAAHLDLITAILTRGKNSRLYKELVYKDQIASAAFAFNASQEIGGQFHIGLNVKPDKTVQEVESAFEELFTNFLSEGPTEVEVKRAKALFSSSFIKGLERIGGFGGKSDILAQNEVYGGSPDYYKSWLTAIADATPEDLHQAAKKWLRQGRYTLIAEPFPTYKAGPELADRSQLPKTQETLKSTFPSLQRTKLKNGMEVVLARREGVPTVVMSMMFNAGYSADQFATPGRAKLSMDLLDEGTQTMDALAINDRLQLLGASLRTSSDLDMSYVNMTTLKQSLDPSLDLMAEILTQPAFSEKELDRLKQQQLVTIAREKSNPNALSQRIFPKILYGPGHAYSIPMTGSGYSETVQAMSRGDILSFYEDWIRPNNAKLVVVGDIGLEELSAKLESRFGDWKKGKTPRKKIATVSNPKGNTLYLIDRPESIQSLVLAGHLTKPYGETNEIARKAMNTVLGGEFTSRINMNLREDKHWTYGARSAMMDAKGQGTFVAYASVQTDRTSESIQEIQKELHWVVGEKPITAAEFEKTRKNIVLKLPGRWETNAAVRNSVREILKYDLEEDYFATYDKKVLDLDLEDVRTSAKELIHPDQLTWIVIGDKNRVLTGLEELGFDQIILLDEKGNSLSDFEAKNQK